MIFVFAIALAEIAMIYFSLVISRENERNYKRIATDLSATVAEVVNSDDVKTLKDKVKTIVDNSPNKVMSDDWGSPEWEEYTAQFDVIKSDPLFINIRNQLRGIVDANTTEIDCLYLSYIDKENEFFVYIVDSADEEYMCPPGCLDPVFDFNKVLFDDPTIGFPAYITNTEEYGYLVTAGAPIYLGKDVVAYSMVDISMTVVRNSQRDSIVKMFIYLMVSVVILSIIGIIVVNFTLIRPVKRIHGVTNAYDRERADEIHDEFVKLKVNTHDELEDLTKSIKIMEDDVYNQIQQLKNMNEEIVKAQQETIKMRELANKDGLTGVRNKASYDQECASINERIANGEKVNFGIAMIDLNYLKITNDEYGHGEGDIALIKLSNIICEVFAHSPVFRVGGDEFTVIVSNLDYKNAEKLIDKFVSKIYSLATNKKLSPAQRTSASIGYSAFDPSHDKCVEDVFKRADEKMYENKRIMKEKIKEILGE